MFWWGLILELVVLSVGDHYEQIAFVAGSRDHAVYCVQWNGEGLRRLSPGDLHATAWPFPIRWDSVHHRLIVRGSDRGKAWLGSLTLDRAFNAIAIEPRMQGLPEISPDGRCLVSTEASRDGTLIRFVELCGSQVLSSFEVPGRARELVWAPNSERILYVCGGLWIVNRGGSGRHCIIHEDEPRVFAPRWSPDGRTILYGRQIFDGEVSELIIGGVPKTIDLFSIGVHDSSVRRLTRDREVSSRMLEDFLGGVWSPDGKWIAYTARVDGKNQLFVCSFDGSVRRQLTEGCLRSYNPAWASDGNHLVFVRETASGTRDLAVISAGGSGLRLFGIDQLDVFWPTCLPKAAMSSCQPKRDE